jgi:hypothetical protein
MTAMTALTEKRQAFRSVGAIAIGLVAITVASSALDTLMHASGIVPVWFQPMAGALYFVTNAYRTVINIAGFYLTARVVAQCHGATR